MHHKILTYSHHLARGGYRIVLGTRNLIKIKSREILPLLEKPRILQFPITERCNSHCIMCNIWKKKSEKEASPEQFRKILSDPLFSEIEYVGINGGEPTIRSDLSEIGEVLVEMLPKLKGLGIITNAVKPEVVINQSIALSKVAKASNKNFSVSVSLDGIGDIHDRNRGVKGNYLSAIKVIQELKSENIPISIGCTLTPINCYYADDVLLWCQENDIPWEFRIGVEINRIYNRGYDHKYQFSPKQKFHLSMFFEKLSHHPSIDDAHRSFYSSIANQIIDESPRESGCIWQNDGVTLDAYGNISYCSVRSPILGSALDNSALEIYMENLPIRDDIIKKYCSTCQHDLLGPMNPQKMILDGLNIIVDPLKSEMIKVKKDINTRIGKYIPDSIYYIDDHDLKSWNHIVITGWYGTETAGDKAILGEVLHFIRSQNPSSKITLTTLNKKVSDQTGLELKGLKDVEIIGLEKAATKEFVSSVDAVVIGGGPLEEINETYYIWRMFSEANRQKKARVIFGCGVGPLYSEYLRQLVSGICQMATAGFFRDKESRDYAIKLGGKEFLETACDPALAYIKRWADENRCFPKDSSEITIGGLLRANTSEYVADIPIEEIKNINNENAKIIAQILNAVSNKYPINISLLPMHTLWIGGDDRIFNRTVADNLKKTQNMYIERRYLTIEDLLDSLSSVDVAIAMRYHGHLFCTALGIPYLSIDYTGRQGKVQNLVKRMEYDYWSEKWSNIDFQKSTEKLEKLIDQRQYWSLYLKTKTSEMVDELENTYARIFGIEDRGQK